MQYSLYSFTCMVKLCLTRATIFSLLEKKRFYSNNVRKYSNICMCSMHDWCERDDVPTYSVDNHG